MNTDTTADPLNKLIKVEEGPAYGSGQLSVADDRLYCQLAHLFSLIVWLWKKNSSPAVDAHGKEALNFAITVFIVFFAASILVALLPGFLGTLAGLSLSLFSFVTLGLAIYGLLLAGKGKLLRYPVNFRLIK